ncbi:hypothetical protein Tco_1302630 [Tanacetum coccineum]
MFFCVVYAEEAVICVSIRLLVPSPLDAGQVNGNYGHSLQDKIPITELKSAIALCLQPGNQHSRTKHIRSSDTNLHKGTRGKGSRLLKMYFVRTDYQLADSSSPKLSSRRFNIWFVRLLVRMRSLSPKELERLANICGNS